MLLLTMLFACGEKEVTNNVDSTTTAAEVATIETKETTNEKTADVTVEVAKDVNAITLEQPKTEVTSTSTKTTNTNEGVTND
jgi:hypothetical protein